MGAGRGTLRGDLKILRMFLLVIIGALGKSRGLGFDYQKQQG